MSNFPDVWLSPSDLIAAAGGCRVVAWDFRDLKVNQLITLNSCLLRPEKLGAKVVECMGAVDLDCGKSPIVLKKYLVEEI